MFTLEEFKSYGLFPSDAVLIADDSKTTLAEQMYVSQKDLYIPGTVLIVDNHKWLAYSKSLGIYFSANENVVGKHMINKNTFRVFELKTTGALPRLKTINYYNLKGENEKMENKDVLDLDNLGSIDLEGVDAALESAGINPVEAGTEKLNAFDGQEAGAADAGKAPEHKDEKDDYRKAITAEVATEKVADIEVLAAFNREYGSLYGYITDKDALVKPTLETKFKFNEKTKAPEWKATATQDIKDQYTRGNKDVLAGNCEESTKVKFKQTAPGKVLSVFIGIPQGGIKTLREIQMADYCEPNKEQKNVVVSNFELDAAIQIVANLFDGEIKENPETFGEFATNVKVDVRTSTKKDKTTGIPRTVQKFILKANKRSNLVCPNAYLPIKTYDTITLDNNITEEQSKLMALSSFWQFYNPTQSKTDPSKNKVGSRKIDMLDDVSQAVENPDKTYSSVFFAVDPNTRTNMVVKPYYKKEGSLKVIEIPIKEKKVSSEGKERYVYKTFSAIGKKDSEEALEKNSLALAEKGIKFNVFYNAVGADLLNEKTLEAVKPGRKAGDKNQIDNTTVRKLLAKQQGGAKAVAGVEFDTTNARGIKGLNAQLSKLSEGNIK